MRVIDVANAREVAQDCAYLVRIGGSVFNDL